MKITCHQCGAAFEASEDDIGKWLVCRQCEAPVRLELTVDPFALGLPPTQRVPAPSTRVREASKEESSQWEAPVRIEPKPRRKPGGSSTYQPRKRATEVGIIGLIASGFFFAASILPSLAPKPPAPRPPAPLVSEEEMERLEGLFFEQTIEAASRQYDEAKRNGSAEDAEVWAGVLAAEYERLGDEAAAREWRTKGRAVEGKQFSQ